MKKLIILLGLTLSLPAATDFDKLVDKLIEKGAEMNKQWFDVCMGISVTKSSEKLCTDVYTAYKKGWTVKK